MKPRLEHPPLEVIRVAASGPARLARLLRPRRVRLLS
jgi:hypothetical protein